MNAPAEIAPKPDGKTSPGWRKPLRWCAGGLAAVLLILIVAGFVIARRLQPLVRARLLQTFQERFHSPASLTELQVHYTGQIQVDGRGLNVQSVLTGVPSDSQHPMLQVQEFHFHLGVFEALSRSPRIHHVRIRGVELDLPPEAAQKSPEPKLGPELDLEYAEVDDAHIRFLQGGNDRAPMQFDLPHLVFRGVSRSRPIRFHAVVDNGPPLGITETDGTIGPWNFDDPRLIPVQGTFSFKDKDVSSVLGLRGRLTLNGRYQGTVGDMHAEGTTDDPAFALDVSSHPVELRTVFAMSLQPAQSAVSLQKVQGSFGGTVFTCEGLAIKDNAAGSFRLDLQLNAPAARVEDALALGTHVSPPTLRGALAVTGRLQMRAGPESVSSRLSLQDGTVAIRDGTFSNPEMQQTFDELAERAQGDPRDANAQRAAHVAASVHGRVALSNEVMHFADVRVIAPGIQSALHGTYSLGSAAFVFDGDVHTAARISHMTTGVRSLFLKPFNGLLGHGDRGATLPVHLQGRGNTVQMNTRIAGFRVKPPGMK